MENSCTAFLVFAGIMLKVKRRATGSDERRKVRKRGVKEVSTIISDLGQGMTEHLGQELTETLSPSIISIASFKGDKLHYKSTGIVIEQRPRGPIILTSSNLIRRYDERKLVFPPLKIKLRLPNIQVVNGQVQNLNLSCNLVVITASFSPDLRAVCLGNSVQVESHTKLLSVKRCFNSGNLMASSGVLIDRPSGVDCESTCKITKDGIGGPLVDFDGNIVGMNNYFDSDVTRYIPANQILKDLLSIGLCQIRDVLQPHSRLGSKDVVQPRSRLGTEGFASKLGVRMNIVTTGHNEEMELDKPRAPESTGNECKHLGIVDPWPSDDAVNKLLTADGYPLPKYADGGMSLEGDLEEEFRIDAWRKKTRRRIALKTCRSVVALGSFNEKGRHFACTGVLIDYNQSIRVPTSANLVRNGNEIVENLRIEVCLPNKKHTTGTLQHYSLQYNVAVVTINDLDGNRAAKFVEEPQTKIVALGRVFKSGNFMATRGVVTGKQSGFDCKELKVSSCKITKAGIGGPLVDFNGKIVGMNFFDMEETPYLPSDMILKLLRQFDLKGTVTAETTKPEPCKRVPMVIAYQ
ncbi:uncharacterized protein LOC104582275 [Brachypodium distachyon]|uniref:uncharacterized protein LOC104582275 n=1 Tax=Brachypodium distachyon TaxID=15368 RepID=UPI000D0D7829|nr:uncharacterized protein LOC104582275 [Brachypodium distachyon]|eukprot:XP_014751773.2 uncharacterized protein LOC104582275 [Brachypodium distachyon]